jgi:GAF domain-containing protein/CHASE3 domain sensor protein
MSKVEAQEAGGRRSRPTIKWRIAHKLTAASVLMIVLTLLAGGVGLWQVLNVGQAVAHAREAEQRRARSLELLAAGRELVASLERMLVTQDAALMSTDVPASLGALTFYMETLQEAGGEPEILGLIEGMQSAHNELLQSVREVNVLARQERWTDVSAKLEQEIRPLNEQMDIFIRRLVQRADRDAEIVAARTQRAVLQAVLLPAILTGLAVIIAWGWRRFIFQELSLSITELRQGVARIGSGDLEHEIDIRTGDEIEELSVEFNKMAAELAGVIGSLEQRVDERTRSLQAAAEVASATTSVLDPDELLRQVVDLVQRRFDLYYVGLFLLDEDRGDAKRAFAVLRAGTGEAGQIMMEQGHRLEVGGSSMIGQCVARSEARIVLDVGEEPFRFDNPVLPETRSEMALPLRSRGHIIGAMTVQSVEEAAFDEADVAVMQTMADQVAVAIDNARLFAETQAALEEMAATQRHYMSQAWTDYKATRAVSGYERTDTGIKPLGDAALPEVQQAMTERRTLVWSGDGGEERGGESSTEKPARSTESSTLAVPITLRGQPIGVLGFTKGGEGQQWSKDDIALAEALSEQFVLAADNVRLLDETQRRAARERLTREITDKMRRASSVEDIVQSAVDELHKVLGTSRTFVRLGVLPKGHPQDDGKKE